MANYAEIIKDEVFFYERDLISTRKLEDIIGQSASRSSTFVSRIIPPNTVAIGVQEDTTMFVIEREPRKIHLRAGGVLADFLNNEIPHALVWDDSECVVQDLPVPWEYYVVSVSNAPQTNDFGSVWYQMSTMYLFWAKNKVEDIEELSLFTCNIPNVSEWGDICLGETNSTEPNMTRRITEVVNMFYDTTFNGDLGAAPGPYRSWGEWVAAGKAEDPMAESVWPITDQASSIKKILGSLNSFVLPNTADLRPASSTSAFINTLLTQLPTQTANRLASVIRQIEDNARNSDATAT